jgi:hypothetical protein
MTPTGIEPATFLFVAQCPISELGEGKNGIADECVLVTELQ